MEKLKSLFIIFLLLIFISLVAGYGAALITIEYSDIITGALLIMSSIAVLVIFIYEFILNGAES